MCFVKSSTPSVPKIEEPQDVVKIQQADADITKNSQNNAQKIGFAQNIKTSALGLDETAPTKKKTLLGE